MVNEPELAADAHTQPQAAYVYVMPLADGMQRAINEIIRNYLKGTKPDKFKEWAATIIPPRKARGGFWAEGFKAERQRPHTHADDGKNAKERYLLLYPDGGEGRVDIVHNGKVERYIFPQGHLSLLHFDGSEPHRFSIVGDKKARLLSFAIHTRDVATDEKALETQTTPFKADMSAFPKAEFRPSEVPQPSLQALTSLAEGITELSSDRIAHMVRLDIAKAKGEPVPARDMEGLGIGYLALIVGEYGTGYGSKSFSDIRSLEKRWEAIGPSLTGKS